jgi:pilus assembly protein CpaF
MKPESSLPRSRADIYRATLERFLAPVHKQLYLDDEINEVMINGHDQIYVERSDGTVEKIDAAFPSEAALRAAVNNLAQYVDRRLDERCLSMNARLPEPERFRVHVIMPPASRSGIVVSIRKFSRVRFTIDTLLEKGTISEAAGQFLRIAIRLKRNLLVSGGTGTGKTSLLNALSGAIPDNERVIVIEDSSELNLTQPHTIYLESRPPLPDGTGGMTIRDLFVDSLRMRPDRIIVGEVRRGEALDLVQSMLSGHDGAMSTVHASSPALALVRLETLSLMSDVNMPVYVARTQVASAIHLVVQISRTSQGRLVTDISEVRGLGAKDQYEVVSLFNRRKRVPGLGTSTSPAPLEFTGAACSFADQVIDAGLHREASLCQPVFGIA